MPIRICHIISGLEANGAEAMLTRLAVRLRLRGYQNSVLSLSSEGHHGPHLRSAGIPITAVELRRDLRLPLGVLQGLRAVRRAKPDIIQTWLYHADLFGVLAQGLVPTARLVWNIRCSDMGSLRYGKLTGGLARLSRIPAAVIVNSAAGQRAHAALGYRPRLWQLIPNGFSLSELRADPAARAAFRASLGVRPDELLIGMVARADAMKDHATFLAAAERMTGARFVLIGRGTENLRYGLGHRGDASRLICGLDILTLCSAYGEGFPNVVGEAMASAVPCVVTDVGDAAAIVGDTGRIVPPRDPAALCAAWQELEALGADGRETLGRRARQRIAEHYQIDAIVDRYDALYATLAAGTA
jgi:glycosyltransferase involved in cell wall biosynthesis